VASRTLFQQIWQSASRQ